MDSLLLFLGSFSLCISIVSCTPFTEFVYPNFTTSNLGYPEFAGGFLFSRNGTFKAAMFNPGGQQARFYLCIIHMESNTVIWSANRNSPVSKSGILSFTNNGLSISEEGGRKARWSTPPFVSSISSLQLTETGNLVLLDGSNTTRWDSFGNPTDTIVIGQRLPIETFLFSSVSKDDLSAGDYSFGLTETDATLRWRGQTYWMLSMHTKAYVNSNYALEYLAINQTGLYLFSQNGSAVVIQVNLPPSEFRVAKIDKSGQFIILSFSKTSQTQDFVVPDDQCRIPYICGKIGLCNNGISVSTPVCSCPSSFHASRNKSTDCVPANSSYLLPGSCNSFDNSSNFISPSPIYLPLGYAVDYFANGFASPAKEGVNLSICQDLCSDDCDCLGIFYDNSSGSCYMVESEVGSVMSTSKNLLGFIKALVPSPSTDSGNVDDSELGFSTVAQVLYPVSCLFLIFVIGIFLWRKYSRKSELLMEKTTYTKPKSTPDLKFAIPGLPSRFPFELIQAATNYFRTPIGTGGFGTVYKGILPDKTPIAVKKIIDFGLRGKREFYSEIAIIGNIHHVNLVRLKGYCAQKRHWLLIYEYMNRGSLDKTLFGNGTVLEWQDRVQIAIGAARGLAYLHEGCEHKIIHCDVKPENILLHDNFQAKISDFGLSKLLSREQSSLFTTMRGTRGYLAPEWLTSSAISDKTDVYSFGMVLLEIISGRKNCAPYVQVPNHNGTDGSVGDSGSVQRQFYFPLYALEMHEEKRYLELVDPRLEGRVRSEDVEKFVRVALCCVHEEPGLRPSMMNVVGMLEGEIPVGEPRVESLNFLRFYGRRYAESSAGEEGRGTNEAMLYEYANVSNSSTRSLSDDAYLSYISSQQISGPR